jgi:hypothetical protein
LISITFLGSDDESTTPTFDYQSLEHILVYLRLRSLFTHILARQIRLVLQGAEVNLRFFT